MGTNYTFVDDNLHIGKTSLGRDALRFVWAIPMEELKTRKHMTIRDEYGNIYTFDEFKEAVLDKILWHNFSSIGTEFS